jgi:hypothetical protein
MVGRPLDQAVGQAAQRQAGQQRAAAVEPPRPAVAAFLNRGAQGQAHRDKRQVDDKDPAPAGQAEDDAADQRADHGGDAPERRPTADRLAALLGREIGVDNSQRPGRDQGAENALHDPECNQPGGVRGQRAAEGNDAEAGQPGQVYPFAAEDIPERAAEQYQGRQRQQVAVDDPLQVGKGDVQAAADPRQGQVDDGTVQEDDAGAQDGGDQDEQLAPAHDSFR